MSQNYRYGHQKVSYAEKRQGVSSIFARVAGQYDLMNDLMSFGVHRLWKRYLLSKVAPFPGMMHLDLAGGTGDIAQRIVVLSREMVPMPQVYVGDLSAEMLDKGRNKAINGGWHQNVTWTQLNGERLPFPSKVFDRVTISFGLRNVARIQDCLAEMLRVLKPEGRALIMEFSQPMEPLRKVARCYNHKFLPFLGEIVAKDQAAYTYLAESIDTFPPQEELCKMMREAGFSRISYENLSGGMVAIHQGAGCKE